MTIKIKSNIDSLKQDAQEFLKVTKNHNIFAFDASMGAGKTTFIQAILKELGVAVTKGSPTYGFVNEYKTDKNSKIFHLDLFRLNTQDEAYDIGIEEIIYDEHYCFIEWPNIIRNLLPPNTVWVNIEIENYNSRTICIDL